MLIIISVISLVWNAQAKIAPQITTTGYPKVNPSVTPMVESFTVLEYLVKSCTIDTPTMKLPTIRETAVAKDIFIAGTAPKISPAGTITKVLTTPNRISANRRGTPIWESILIPLYPTIAVIIIRSPPTIMQNVVFTSIPAANLNTLEMLLPKKVH